MRSSSKESTPFERRSSLKKISSQNRSPSKSTSGSSPPKLTSASSGSKTNGSTLSPGTGRAGIKEGSNESAQTPSVAAVAAATGDSAAVNAVTKMKGHMNVVPIGLKEAAIDSPSFRASSEYMDHLVMNVEQWLDKFCGLLVELNSEMNGVKDKVNEMLGIFLPSFANSGFLAQDYTSLLFGRYAQMTHQMWSDIISTHKAHEQKMKDAIEKAKRSIFAEYHSAREMYIVEQKNADEKFAAYMAMNKHTGPEDLRKAALAMFESRKRYKRASFDLCIALHCVKSETTILLLESLSQPFRIKQCGFQYSGVGTLDARVEMHRLNALSRRLRYTTSSIKEELIEVSDDIMAQFTSKEMPSIELDVYREYTASPCAPVGVPKLGCVLLSFPRQNKWVPRWLFVSNGVFGWTGLSPDKTYVQESFKCSAADCEVECLTQCQRRFVFKVVAPGRHSSVEIQAISKQDLSEWLAAFKYYRRTSAADDKEIVLEPFLAEYQLNDDDLTGDRPVKTAKVRENLGMDVERRLKESIRFQVAHSALITSSTLGQSAHGLPVPSILSVKPMPTARFQEAAIGDWLAKPEGFPNALTSNFCGTIDWISKEKQTEFNYQDSYPRYPSWYPLRMVYQDGDMRAALERSSSHFGVQEDLLLMLLRVTVRLNGNKELPARLYVTSRQLTFYLCWGGFVSVHSVDIGNIVESDVKPYIDYDEMLLVFQGDDGSTDTVPMRFYIDSAALAKRRLDFLITNRRGDRPKEIEWLLEQISAMGDEHAELSTSHKNDDSFDFSSNTAPDYSSSVNSSSKLSISSKSESDHPAIRRLLANYLHCSAANPSEDAGQHATAGRDNQWQLWKLGEDVYPFPATIVFHAIFGDKSSLFRDMWPELDPQIGPWVLRRNHIERLIHEAGMKLPGQTTYSRQGFERVHLQRVTNYDSTSVFIVTEKRAGWELPDGSVFFITYNYRIFSTETGSILRIFGQLLWDSEPRSSLGVVELAAHEVAKAQARKLIIATRNIISKLPHVSRMTPELYEQLGRVRASKTVTHLRGDVSVTKLNRSLMLKTLLRKFLQWMFTLGKFILKRLDKLRNIMTSSIFWGISVTILSILLNIYLLTGFFSPAWSSKWSEARGFSSTGPMEGLISKRVISIKEIDSAISSGVLFEPSGSIANTTCGGRFLDVINLTSRFEDLPIKLEHFSQTEGEKIAQLRTAVGIQRNKLLAEIRLLNAYETEMIKREWSDWLSNELKYCVSSRSVYHSLGIDVLSRVRDYCISCEEAAGLL